MASANDLLTIATTAASAAGAYLRAADRPRDPAGWTAKGRADFATHVDRAAEEIIVRILTAAAPGSTVVGEELSPTVVTEGLVWIVDPLDGTTNFLHGFPAFAVSIAAALDGTLEAAVVLHVPLDRLSTATRGGGAFENGLRIQVSPIEVPEHALIGTGFPYRDFARLDAYMAQLARVTLGATGVRRPGSAAIDLSDVAAGRLEGFWEQRLSAWDIAAGTLLVREAGGLVTDFSGRSLGVEHGEVLAGNPAIHRWLLSTLNHSPMTRDRTLGAFGEAVAAGTPAPGGGAVGAVAGSLAAALAGMVGRLALARVAGEPGFEQLIASADRLRDRLLELAHEDEAAFRTVVEANRARDEAATAKAWRTAARVPAEVVRHCRDIAQLARRAAREGPQAAVGDAVMAALLAAAAGAGSLVNLRLNVQAAGRPADLRVLADNSESILRETQRAAAEARLAVEERLGGGVGGA